MSVTYPVTYPTMKMVIETYLMYMYLFGMSLSGISNLSCYCKLHVLILAARKYLLTKILKPNLQYRSKSNY